MTRLCAYRLCKRPIPDSKILRAKYCSDRCRLLVFRTKDTGDRRCKVCGEYVAYSRMYCTEKCRDLDKERGKCEFICKNCGKRSTVARKGAKFCSRVCRVSYSKENSCTANKYSYNCELCGKPCVAGSPAARFCRGPECRRIYENRWKKMRREGGAPESLGTDGRIVWKEEPQVTFKDVKLKTILAPLS